MNNAKIRCCTVFYVNSKKATFGLILTFVTHTGSIVIIYLADWTKCVLFCNLSIALVNKKNVQIVSDQYNPEVVAGFLPCLPASSISYWSCG